ncbi:MAG TPA: cytochrome c oxidase subunit II [Candidatus Baltobacteraceae bacterium]|nr:cytochrome c oxidase subunit II [Candidatus Baltobacteraceae bacterium]
MVGRLATLAALIGLAGCAAIPNDTTVQAADMHRVWAVFIVAGLAVYVLVGGLILWSALAYRRRDPSVVQANAVHKNTPLEIGWTIAPIIVVAGLFLVTFPAEQHVENMVKRPGEVVQVVAFRWSWRFVYANEHVVVQGTTGSPPELVLPENRTTEIRLTSSDVIHSFWVPSFLFKRMAIPGIVNAFDFTPERAGVFMGRCAELCGTYHAHMSFTVRVLPADQFARWVRARSAA